MISIPNSINHKKLSLVALLALSPSFLLASTTTTATTSQSNTPFQGFYIGALAGGTQKNVKGSLDASGRNNIGELVNLQYGDKKSISAFSYGAVVGYGTTNSNNIYLGAEAGVSHDTSNKYRSYKFQKGTIDGDPAIATGEASSVQIKYERGPALCVAPRIGIVVDKKYLLFARLGVEISRDRLANKGFGDSNEETTKRKTRIAFAPGAGIELALNQNWIARVQYEYSIGSKITGIEREGGATVTSPVSYDSHSIKVGLLYRFG